MALIGNRSVLHKSPMRYLNAGVATFRSNFAQSGQLRSAAYSALSAIPNGHLAPSAWFLPRSPGGMSSVGFMELTIATSGLAVGGITTTGTADLTITFADSAAQLIASGMGSASWSITTNTPLLTASIGGTGTASLSITPNTPILGAEASAEGTASLTITATSSGRFPLNDASPLRTGEATMTITGSLVPYAKGHMTGTTEESGLTNAGIANSVWAKVIEAGFSAEQILRIMAAQAAGSATGLEGSDTKFTGLDGVTTRIDGSYAAGTRTIDSLNGS